ncbi:MAG: hypothetical protein JOZ75_14920 [Candidatus Dormibacteraeota bacterium]|nr:hypothetical protein [Candidatus Dormibacteraeota bacterium]
MLEIFSLREGWLCDAADHIPIAGCRDDACALEVRGHAAQPAPVVRRTCGDRARRREYKLNEPSGSVQIPTMLPARSVAIRRFISRIPLATAAHAPHAPWRNGPAH